MAMNFLNKNKWTIIIGTITSIIFIVITYFFWKQAQSQAADLRDLIVQSFPLFFISGCLAELLNKSQKITKLGMKSISMAIFEFILYLAVFWIGFLVVAQKAWEKPLFEFNAGFFIFYPLVFLIVSFIPMNLAGGFLVFGLRKITKKKE